MNIFDASRQNCLTEIQRTINGADLLIKIEAYPSRYDRESLDYDILQAWDQDLDKIVKLDSSDLCLSRDEVDYIWGELND